jgi:hypothetical protein
MKRTALIALIPALLFVSLLSGQSLAEIDLASDQRTAVELLPESCLAVAQMPHPDRLLTTLTEHAVWQKIKDHPEYEAAVSNPGYQMFLGIRTSIETQIGMKWRDAYDTVLGGGITIAFDPETQGVVGLVRAKDGEKLAATAETLIRLGQEDAKSKGNEQLPEDKYRGITVYGMDEGLFAIVGPWLVMVNKGELGKKMIDTLLDGSDSSLQNNEKFKAARASIDGDPALWAWLDLGTLRDAGFAEALEKNQTNNPAAELLIGGILTNLRQTPFVTGALYVTGESTRLTLAAPHKAEWVEEFREYWFGPDGNGVADPPLETESTIFSLTTYRKVSDMWLRAGDLFDERMNDELAKADANLTTFFAGKDFGEDILGSFGPHLQLVVNRQDFADVLPKPAIRLPSFALTGYLENADETKTELRRTFQSLIGFLNVIGAMEGNPQLDQDVEIYGDHKIYTASFIAEPDEKKSERAKIQFNFSPSLAFAGDRFILASTNQLAKELADASTEKRGAKRVASNTGMRLDAKNLGIALNDNREQLIANNMISDGHTREEAEQQIGILMEVLGLFREASFDLKTTDGQLRIELAIETVK